MLLDGETIPNDTSIDQHRLNSDYQDGFWAIVKVDISKLSVKSRRAKITIAENLL